MLNTLNVAQSGLTVSKKQVEGVMNNVANENTPGYKARVVNTSELDHLDSRITGRGAIVDSVSRITNVYMYQNLVEEQSKQSAFEELDIMLEDIESIFYETDESGLSADLNRYFQSIENLRTSPQNEIYREDLKNNANILVESLQTLYGNIEDLEDKTLNSAQDTVTDINAKLSAIGDLSQEIIDSITTPNDLLDKRDALEQELAQYIDITISRDSSYELELGGQTAVRFDTNVHTLSLVEDYKAQKDVYIQNGVLPYTSNLIDTTTWDNEGPDSITYKLDNTVEVSVTYGEDLYGDGSLIVDETNAIQSLVYKINTKKEMLGKIQAFNGQYDIDKNGNKVLTNDPNHSDYDLLDPDKDRYLIIEASIEGEEGSFVGEIIVNDTEGANVSRTHIDKDLDTSEIAEDDIYLQIFDKKVELESGTLKSQIDNIQTQAELNKFREYKEKLDQFAKALSDYTDAFIETSQDNYVYGKNAIETHTDYDNKVEIGLFSGASVKTLTFNDNKINSLTQEKLDYLATIQWKDDIDFDGTGESNTSFSKFYQTLRVRIADDRENTLFRKESQTAVTESLNNTYDKLTKVDKDKEMVDLIKFQAAYEANAKLITVVDEMLATILGMKK